MSQKIRTVLARTRFWHEHNDRHPKMPERGHKTSITLTRSRRSHNIHCNETLFTFLTTQPNLPTNNKSWITLYSKTATSNMSSTIVIKSAAKLAAARITKPSSSQHYMVARVVHSSPSSPGMHVSPQDYYYTAQHNDDESYYSSFESTLERVLEMAQLGQQQPSDTFEQVVRSCYYSEYQV